MVIVPNEREVKKPTTIKLISGQLRFEINAETLGTVTISIAQLLDCSPLLRRQLAVALQGKEVRKRKPLSEDKVIESYTVIRQTETDAEPTIECVNEDNRKVQDVYFITA